MTSPAASKRREKKTRTSGDGGKVDRVQKIKEGALLGNHPEIHLVCGSTAEVITQWVRRLQHLRATASHAFKGSTVEERVESFKEACIRRCSVAGLRPGHLVKASADLHHRFLLTEEQLDVRDSQAELLHISGPYGSGKTLLLAERARRWLREGRRLALAVGILGEVLLRHLSESVCGEKTDVARVSTHKNDTHLLEWLDTISTEDPVSIIMDEAVFSTFPYSSLLDHVTAGRVRGLWTAYTTPLSDELERKLQSLGGSTVQLSLCLRCPAHVMAWTHSVRETDDPPLLPPPVPVTRELGVEVEVISHPDHRHSLSWRTCPRCREEVRAFTCPRCREEGRAFTCPRCREEVTAFTCPRCEEEGRAFTCPRCEEEGRAFTCPRCREEGRAFTCPRCEEEVMAFTCPRSREEVKAFTCPRCGEEVTAFTCPICREEVKAFFSSLGLHGQHATSALSLSDVVVLTTDPDCDREQVAAWLRGLGVHAVSERETGRYNIPVLPPGVAPTSPDIAEEEAFRQRILKGKDVTGSPAVQVVECYDFQGLERKVVLLWHQDWEDEDRDRQTQEWRKARMSRHRYWWLCAASRCQGRLAVMAATPSPVLSLLPATSPPKSSAATASSNSPVTSASHHSPVSSSSLGRESNPQPPVRPSGRSSTKAARQDLKSNPRPSSPPE